MSPMYHYTSWAQRHTPDKVRNPNTMNVLNNLSPELKKTAPEVTASHKRSRGISWLFAAIWIAAAIVVARLRDDIPTYMLLTATVFFFMLVPSMNDLVKDYEKYMDRFRNRTSGSNPDQ